jgi:Plasma-membrane choline transporter
VCFFISLAYVGALRLPFLLNSVIWGSIFATIFIVLGTAFYLYWLAQYWDNQVPQKWPEESIVATKFLSYGLFILGAILILLMICLRKQIQLAIGCVKEAGKAVTSMPAILLVPCVQAIGFIIALLVSVTYGIYLASQGQIVSTDVPINPLSGLEITVRTAKAHLSPSIFLFNFLILRYV